MLFWWSIVPFCDTHLHSGGYPAPEEHANSYPAPEKGTRTRPGAGNTHPAPPNATGAVSRVSGAGWWAAVFCALSGPKQDAIK